MLGTNPPHPLWPDSMSSGLAALIRHRTGVGRPVTLAHRHDPHSVGVQVAPGAAAATVESLAGFQGLAWVGGLQGNGGRDTAVLVPRGTDLGRPVEVMVYFDGAGGSAAHAIGVLKSQIEALPQHGRNAVVVVPSSGAMSTWMAPEAGESLTQLQDQAVAVAGRLAGGHLQLSGYSVAGYSCGGWALANAATAGQLRADRITLFDATYADRGERIAAGRRPGATMNVFFTEHNRHRAQRLIGLPGVHVEPSGTHHRATPVRHFLR